jgi:hypothetical protein
MDLRDTMFFMLGLSTLAIIAGVAFILFVKLLDKPLDNDQSTK